MQMLLTTKKIFKLGIVISLLFSYEIDLIGQERLISHAMTDINETWTDKNGDNTLNISVDALCIPGRTIEKGRKSEIKISLENKKYSLEIEYNEENYEEVMILFYEEDINFIDSNRTQVILIPFYYCGNIDQDIKISYIILHNDLKFLKHICFYCDENGKCELNDNLKEKIKDMPSYLQKILSEELKRYKYVTDFYDHRE